MRNWAGCPLIQQDDAQLEGTRNEQQEQQHWAELWQQSEVLSDPASAVGFRPEPEQAKGEDAFRPPSDLPEILHSEI